MICAVNNGGSLKSIVATKTGGLAVDVLSIAGGREGGVYSLLWTLLDLIDRQKTLTSSTQTKNGSNFP